MTTDNEALPPIERDEHMDRTYIPLPGGWEVQTKGKGSTFRLCDTKSGDRWPVLDYTVLHEVLERMAREIRAALSASPQAPQARFLFVAMDDDKQAHLTWCADEAAVHEAVKAAMFWLHEGEQLDADHAEQLDGSVAELLDSGSLTFEGDAPLYLYRVGSASPQAPAAQPQQTEGKS